MDGRVVIWVNEGGSVAQAEAFSRANNIPISDKPGDGLTLVYGSEGVSLAGYGLSFRGDFERIVRRVTKGRIMQELLVRAAKSTKTQPIAIDATAGMGEDSFLLAAYGYDVTLCEQNPVIAELLRDALSRAATCPDTAETISRMHLVCGDSVEFMKSGEHKADVVYLDPMFPARQKSGLINKKLQLIQKLEPPCCAENDLFEAALAAQPAKIIVKRPLKSPNLAGRRPSYTLSGKAIRFDCYVIRT